MGFVFFLFEKFSMPFTTRFPSFFVPLRDIVLSVSHNFCVSYLKENKGRGIIFYDSIISIFRVYPRVSFAAIFLCVLTWRQENYQLSCTLRRLHDIRVESPSKNTNLNLGLHHRWFPVVEDDAFSPTPVTISRLPVVSLCSEGGRRMENVSYSDSRTDHRRLIFCRRFFSSMLMDGRACRHGTSFITITNFLLCCLSFLLFSTSSPLKRCLW